MDEMPHWQMFLVLVGLVAAWSGVILGAIRFMLTKNNATIAQRLSEIGKVADKNSSLEREILELKADLPLNYLRRDDFIRHEVIIDTKLDRTHDKIVNLWSTVEQLRKDLNKDAA
mgnify:CR=1 FL=1